MVVHHDLSTVGEYFDTVMLMNKRLIAMGSTAEVFNKENLRNAYGGKLAIFDADAMAVAGQGG